MSASFSHLLNDTIQSIIPAVYLVLKDSFQFSFDQIDLIDCGISSADRSSSGDTIKDLEFFRYQGAAKEGGTLEYIFEAGEQNSPDSVTKDKAAEIAADFMTIFYHVQVGTLESHEFRETPAPFWLICFSDPVKGPLHQIFFVVLLPRWHGCRAESGEADVEVVYNRFAGPNRRTDSYPPGIPGGSKEGSLLPGASAFAIRRYAVRKGVQTHQIFALLY